MDPVSSELLERVLGRLGLPGPPSPDRTGLDALYRGWCCNVPFDNTRKVLALRSGPAGPLPGIDPEDFLETWLEHGPGGTCWPSCNALFALVDACGFEAERLTASMADMGQANHGTIIVRIHDADYLVDSSMLLNRIVHLRADETVLDDDPLRPCEYETVDGTLRLWFEFPRQTDEAALPCRLMDRGVGEQAFREAYEASRSFGPFNHQLVATRNHPDRIESFQGRTQITRTVDGARRITTHDATSLRKALVDVVGLSPAFVEEWADSGALDASLEDRPHQGPPITEVPPSRRRSA